MVKANKNKRILTGLLKILLFLALLWLFFNQVKRIDWSGWNDFSLYNPFYLLCTILLIFVNWGFEWLKWREVLLLSKVSASSGVRLKSFLAGIITGLLTPNMLGNFIGRMFYFPRRNRPEIILLTLFANAAQFLASIFFGLLALVWLGIREPDFAWTQETFIGFTALILVVLSLLYFRFEHLPLNFLRNNKYVRKVAPMMKGSRTFRGRLLVFSFLRHATFSFQYWLLLKAFGLEVSLEWLGWIWQVFFWATLIPSLWFGKLVVRESMALWILSPLTGNPAVILFASVFLWIMNQAVPAAIGIPYLGKNNSQAL